MLLTTPQGITPPTPGLEHEEPELMREEDIPSDDGGIDAVDDAQARDERPQPELERE
jgi:hypothetical protein